MGYYLDLKTISIDKFGEMLKTATLIPSWMILKENIDKNLSALKNHQVTNLDELLKTLKDKDKIREFSQRSGLSEDYLATLKRVVNGYLQKPNKIKDFPNIPENIVSKLDSLGIKHTLHLYEHIVNKESRSKFSNMTGFSKEEIVKLTKLTDLSRIKWVNHTFAYVLLECNYDTTEKLAKANYKELYLTVKQLNAERKIYNAHIGENDMKMVIEAAQMVPLDVIYD